MSRPALSLLLLAMSTVPVLAADPLMSVSHFDKKARGGEPVNVVFFGGSLTWGANASDPLITSYRGRTMRYLAERYPRTAIHFHDAAIGGTGSDLGLFRMERDVLPYHPDLVFLDFTVNDGAEGSEPEPLATYERIVRNLMSSGSAVVPVLLCFKYHMTHLDAPLPARLQSHIKLAAAYHLPVANVFDAVRSQLKEKTTTTDTLWDVGKDDTHPGDGAHPGDEGYRVFFESVKETFEKAAAAADDAPPVIPESTVFDDKFPHFQRTVLVNGTLPKGWKPRGTYRTSLWFDGLASRWMGNVAVANNKDAPEPLEMKFTGSLVGIFGEHDGFSPAIRVFIDGKPVAPPKAKDGDVLWHLDTSRFAPPKKGSGNLFLWQCFSKNLPDGEHTLRIEPVFDPASPDSELRIESVCTAGR